MNDFGFITIAQNTDSVDYVQLATLQAMMLKNCMSEIQYAIVVDEQSKYAISDEYAKYFDHVIVLNQDRSVNDTWKFRNEPQIYHLSPFKYTIKLESDLLINRSITHWFDFLSQKNLVISHGCKTFTGDTATSRYYRKIFDENNLPDLYTGLMYFDKSTFSESFFDLAQEIFVNWETYSNELKYGKNTIPTTDVVYAISAMILGVENCCVPSAKFFQFVHMKQRINNWISAEWDKSVVFELDEQIRICGVNQYDPLHYHVKTLVTPQLLKQYESYINRSK